MTKKEIIEAVSDRTGIHRAAVANIIEQAMEVCAEAFQRNESIFLRGFGTFECVTRKAKKARDIRAGKTIDIPEQVNVRFKLSKNIKNLMNEHYNWVIKQED